MFSFDYECSFSKLPFDFLNWFLIFRQTWEDLFDKISGIRRIWTSLKKYLTVVWTPDQLMKNLKLASVSFVKMHTLCMENTLNTYFYTFCTLAPNENGIKNRFKIALLSRCHFTKKVSGDAKVYWPWLQQADTRIFACGCSSNFMPWLTFDRIGQFTNY